MHLVGNEWTPNVPCCGDASNIIINQSGALAAHAFSPNFNGCPNLITVSMPNITKVGDFAFDNCYALVSIDISSAMTIGDFAFAFCFSLFSVKVNSDVVIGTQVFTSNSQLSCLHNFGTRSYSCYFDCAADSLRDCNFKSAMVNVKVCFART
jgi:hypothetical protein